MKKVLVCCTAGVSTSLLVSKMQHVATERNLGIEIEAHPMSDAVSKISEADLVLLSPQIGFAKGSVEEVSTVPVSVIDQDLYARADAPGIMDGVAELLEL
ncbi:PTS sugar transporter subunit IIB [Collinsella sp. AGMB00827]|uniref:PTS sugar transporter subunit IIB n=1 Tax=Collinsella ureilytica TaxID=2869515 RepID=A0ABS7MJA7_9ACTN|nr:PTS sugar transporter subunit IIB [Collinsella urealyticum]MBY4797459.1 PTS sugar transporter subunit IIB [Collinsella urealyticum]